MKKEALAINTHRFSAQGKSDNMKVRTSWHGPRANNIAQCIDESGAEKLAKIEEFVKKSKEIAHGTDVCIFDFNTHNINKLSTLCNFF